MFRRHFPPSRVAAAIVAVACASTLTACEDHTVAIRFEPAIGDRYDFRSDVTTDITRTLDGETTREHDESTLGATETVTGIDGDEITLDVALERDGAPARAYTVRVNRSDRLTAIDLVEGVPAEALDLDLASDLPADVASPPAGPLEPGARWAISRTVEASDGGQPTVVTGTGRVESLGVQDGHDIATVVVELRVPIRSQIDTADGAVQVRGVQYSTSRTTYDLDDGAARGDDTTISGDLVVVVDPPVGVVAEPARFTVDYQLLSTTQRIER